MLGVSPKLANLILYLAGHPKVTTLGKTKLYKLVYFIDTTHLRETGHSVTRSEFIKYEHGPVPSRAEKAIKRLIRHGQLKTQVIKVGGTRMEKFTPLVPPDLSHFSETELSTINSVCARFGAMTAKALSEISHEEPAWRYADMQDKLSPDLMMYGVAEDPDGL